MILYKTQQCAHENQKISHTAGAFLGKKLCKDAVQLVEQGVQKHFLIS